MVFICVLLLVRDLMGFLKRGMASSAPMNPSEPEAMLERGHLVLHVAFTFDECELANRSRSLDAGELVRICLVEEAFWMRCTAGWLDGVLRGAHGNICVS